MYKKNSTSAKIYDQAAVFPREIATRMMERLTWIKLKPQWILEVGARTGYAARLLEKSYSKAKLLVLDNAPEMLLHASKQTRLFTRQCFIRANAYSLPLPDQSIDFIFANLMPYTGNEMATVLLEWQRVLKPQGLLMFSTLGPSTLQELRQSFAAVDTAPHVQPFMDIRDIGAVLMQARFSDPVLDVERFTLTYRDPKQLLQELKALGSLNRNPQRHRFLTGKEHMRKMFIAYDKYRTTGSLIPATFEVIYGHAWGTGVAATKKAKGEISVAVGDIRGRK